MLLAAGLGTRLKPLTHKIPKPLLQVHGLPLIAYNLALLKKFGFHDVVINLHYLAGLIKKELGNGKKWGFCFIYSYEKKILGTGGGLKKTEKYFKKEPFLVINSDIIVDLDLNAFVSFHKQKKAIATLAVREHSQADDFGALYINEKNEVVSILEKPKTRHGKLKKAIFCGLHVIDPHVFTFLKKGKKQCIIRDGYIPLLKKGQKISAFFLKGYWNDLGTIKRFQQTEQDFLSGKLILGYQEELQRMRN